MITITLNKIKEHDPCKKGWKILLKSKPGKRKNEPFPLSDILDSNGLEDALWALRCIPEFAILWRKYAVWCARQILHLMEDQRSINALNVAWRHSRGEIVSETALDAASDAAWDAALDATSDPALAAAEAAALATTSAITSGASSEAASGAASDAAMAAASAAAWDAASAAALDAQTAKLRQILDAGEWVE